MKDHFRHYSSILQEQARDLKQNLTGPERKLWFCFLKEQKPRFHCQKIIGPYIVDFFCAELRLAIELDGESHEETALQDELRTEYLHAQGIRVLRFTNNEVMTQFEAVCQTIWNEIYDKTPRCFAPPPCEGGTGEVRSMKTVTIYTDGACSGNPGPGGWGAILCYAGIEKELSGGEAMTTNNRMELTAVITALEALKEPCTVELYSDSKYVIDGLQKGWAKSWKAKGWRKADKKPALNPDLWDRLLQLTDTHQMVYHWVKGHAENEKNNRCDEMAVAESKKF